MRANFLLAACHEGLTFKNAAGWASKYGGESRFPSSQPIIFPSHKSSVHSLALAEPQEAQGASCLTYPHCWNSKGLTLAALRKGDDTAKADSESQLCYLCGCPERFPWLRSEPAQLSDVHQRYLHAEAGNMSSCGSTKPNGVLWLWQSTRTHSKPLFRKISLSLPHLLSLLPNIQPTETSSMASHHS